MGVQMDDQKPNDLWQELGQKITEIQEREGRKESYFFGSQMLLHDEKLTKMLVVQSTLEMQFRRKIFGQLETIISRVTDPEFVIAKSDYFAKYHDLQLDASWLRTMYVESCANMIYTRAKAMVDYVKSHFDEMLVQMMEYITDEAGFSVTLETASLLEHPKLGNVSPKTVPPLVRDVRRVLVDRFEDQVMTRLGRSGGRQANVQKQQLLDGIVPLYYVYLRRLEKLKDANPENLNEEDKYLYNLANRPRDEPRIKACEVLIERHGLDYDPEYLYQLINTATQDEEKLLQSLRKMILE